MITNTFNSEEVAFLLRILETGIAPTSLADANTMCNVWRKLTDAAAGAPAPVVDPEMPPPPQSMSLPPDPYANAHF